MAPALPCPHPFLSFIFLIFSLLSDRDQDLHSRQDFEIPHHQVNWKQVTGAPSEGRHILPIFRWLQTISPSLAERAMAVWPSPDWAPHLPRDCQPLLPHISLVLPLAPVIARECHVINTRPASPMGSVLMSLQILLLEQVSHCQSSCSIWRPHKEISVTRCLQISSFCVYLLNEDESLLI